MQDKDNTTDSDALLLHALDLAGQDETDGEAPHDASADGTRAAFAASAQEASGDSAALDEAYQDVCDLRSVLLKEQAPIDVEGRLKAFKARHTAGATQHRSRKARTIAIGALLAAAAALALVWVRKPGLKTEPKAMAMTDKARHARYAIISDGKTAAKAFTASTNRLTIPKEAYMLQQADGSRRLLSVPYGCSADITLPDGSVAYVHTGSELSFSPQYINGKRVVILDGEAYFRVKHDERHPFIVHAGGVTTTVYGTEFNVNSHDRGGVTVTLVTGSVGVEAPHFSQRIVPGEQVAVGEGTATCRRVDLLPYTNWRDGYLYYDHEPLRNIVTDLAHNYNLDVRFDDKEAMDMLTHFVCERGADISTAISMLNQMHKVHVRLDGHTLVVEKAGEGKTWPRASTKPQAPL